MEPLDVVVTMTRRFAVTALRAITHRNMIWGAFLRAGGQVAISME